MMEPLRKWLKENYNITLRSQMPYGTYMETSEMGMAMDYVETETLNMKDQTDTYRLWVAQPTLWICYIPLKPLV